MRKLLFGNRSAVLFLEEKDRAFLAGLTSEHDRADAVHTLLALAQIELPPGELLVELFERDGQSILFVTAVDEPETCAIFRFRCADDLIDAVRSLRTRVGSPDHSELCEYKGALYLIISPPFSTPPEQLCEFAEHISGSPDFIAYLREYGRILASPAALSELSDRF